MSPLPLRADFNAQTTRSAARRSKDGPQARRLLALAAIYDGATRTEAAKIGGVGVQIVRDCGSSMLSMKAPPPETFRSGRDFAAWFGLTPKIIQLAGGKDTVASQRPEILRCDRR